MKELIIEKDNACCVTGHRTLYADFDEEFTEEVFLRLIERGFDTFLVGMAVGFDTACFKILEKLRKEYKYIKIIACVPCPEQASRFNFFQKKEYERMLKSADEVTVLSEFYTKWCMQKRNEFMVNNSSVVVCYVRKQSGGTVNTLKYALKKGLEIIKV